MEERYGQASRVWALDRGMVSEQHIEWLKERGSRYIVGTPKAQLKSHERELLEGDWRQIREGLEVKLKPVGNSVETFILCRSADRKLKERAMRERFAERIEKGLDKLVKACQRSKQQVGIIERRVGRLLERQQRAGKFYKIEVKATEAGALLTWQRLDEVWKQYEQRDGCYVLRSNVTDWTADVDAGAKVQRVTEEAVP